MLGRISFLVYMNCNNKNINGGCVIIWGPSALLDLGLFYLFFKT